MADRIEMQQVVLDTLISQRQLRNHGYESTKDRPDIKEQMEHDSRVTVVCDAHT
mgnify:CR=1 FL=1